MIGAILCGGFGKRLRPLTDRIPKPLLEIKKDYTILDKQILQLKYAGINQVVLLCGYLHEKIQERFGKKWNGVEINYLIEDEPKGTLYAINNLLDNFESDDYVIRNGDVVCDVNIKEMISQHKNKMLMYITPLISPYGIAELSGNKIIGFKEKPKLDHYLNAGIYIISKDIKPIFSKHKEGSVEELSFPEIAKSGLMNYYKEGVFWQSVDSIKDLQRVNEEYLNKEDKPWGYEKIIVLTDKYLTKELYLMKNEGTSHHKHEKKDETMHITSGEVIIKFDDKEVNIKENKTIRIEPCTPHTILALENTILQEYSTPHPNDTIRIKDKYKR
ncbi:MAG: sugar phosphate nucleotidyltransferase [Patescibacteria group bacterium]|nr:sugar phosphate nucleotidyltransferase [Patescibacteria group bacterium]